MVRVAAGEMVLMSTTTDPAQDDLLHVRDVGHHHEADIRLPGNLGGARAGTGTRRDQGFHGGLASRVHEQPMARPFEI